MSVLQKKFDNSSKLKTVIKAYGLLPQEASLLFYLNDYFSFSFEELAMVVQKLPKSYSSSSLLYSRQRILDSLKWMQFVKTLENSARLDKLVAYLENQLHRELDIMVAEKSYQEKS